MGHTSPRLEPSHKTLVLSQEKSDTVEFAESCARPRVEFTEEFITIGCHKVSREAWRQLNARYEDSRKPEVMQEGTY